MSLIYSFIFLLRFLLEVLGQQFYDIAPASLAPVLIECFGYHLVGMVRVALLLKMSSVYAPWKAKKRRMVRKMM